MKSRPSGRAPDELRPIRITRHFTRHAEGSVLIECGETRVLCTASVEETVPGFLRNTGKGWVTAEYGMLPRSTSTRSPREASRGKQSGRTMEIQRLIGRSLRTVLNLSLLGNRTLWVDCDVVQADGGTRTASITGAFVAIALAVKNLTDRRLLEFSPLRDFVAATSVGMIGGEPCLDLDYAEDSKAEVDLNLVMTGKGHFVEIQGTAERDPFSEEQLAGMLDLGAQGIRRLVDSQREVLASRADLKRLIPVR